MASYDPDIFGGSSPAGNYDPEVFTLPDELKTAPIERVQVQQDARPAANRMSIMDRIGMGMADPIHGGAQLLTNMLPKGVVEAGNRFNNWIADQTGLVSRLPEGGVDQMVRQREADYKASRGSDSGIDWARLAGNVLSPVNAAAGGLAVGATTLPGRMGAGALAGGMSSALAPVTEGGDFASDKAKQVAIGGGMGAAIPLLGAGLSRIISPKASTDPALQMLKERGVGPTVGQSMGGWMNRTEEKLQSTPIIGDTIRYARGRARDQFNKAAIDYVGEPIGVKATGIGQQSIDDIHSAVSQAFERGKRQLGHFQLDGQARQELANLRAMAQNLPDKELNAFQSVWKLLGKEVSPNGSLVADGFRRWDSKAGKEAADFLGSSDAYQKKAGEAIKELQRIVLDAAERANPQAAETLSKAKEAFARLVRVENASLSAKGTQGVFTPGQLLTGVRQADRSVRDNATARGKALMQDLANAGQSVLGNKYPDSGTAGRMGLGLAGLGAGYIDPMIPAGLLGGSALYTPPAQALLRGLLTSRPQGAQTAAEALNYAAPMLAPAAGLLGLQFGQ